MTLEQLTLTDEEVQDIVGSLINGSSNADVVYDDTNDTLIVSLSDSISVNTLEAGTITDGADVSHSDELADASDLSPIQSSSDVVVTDTQVGTLEDGEFLQNSGGSLAGGTVSAQGAFSNIDTFESNGTFDASNVDFAFVEVVGGGGGGGGNTSRDGAGSGGAGGGYAFGFVDLSGTSSVTVTVGGGGFGAGSGGGDGGNGGSSSFGTFMSATGGGGGVSTFLLPPPTGGSGSGGDVNTNGGTGGVGASDGTGFLGGNGGDSVYGGGAPGQNSLPVAADGFGSGGHGTSQGNFRDAGDGTGGIVIVRH
jgi:hypothetical protein